MLKRIFYNFTYLSTGQILSGILYFITTVFIARCFGTEKFGMFTFAESVFLFFSLIVVFGSDYIGAREIAKSKSKNEDEKIVTSILFIRLVAGAISFLALFLFILFFRMAVDLKVLVLICGVPVISLIFLLDWFFWGKEKFGVYSGCAILRDLFFLLGVIAVWMISKCNILLVGLIFSLSKILYSCLTFFLYTRNHKILRSKEGIINREYLFTNCNILFFSSIIGWVVHNFDIVFMAFVYEKSKIGIYSAAYRPIFYLIMLFGVFLKSIFPIMSQAKKIHYIKEIMFFLLLIFVFVGFLFSKPLVLTIYGNQYLESIALFRILIFVVFFMSLNMFYSQELIVSNQEAKSLRLAVINGVGNILLIFLFIPVLGIFSFAWGKVLSQGVGLLYYHIRLKNEV